MKRPPPIYMPSWPGIPNAPASKKRRSPGCNASGGTGVPSWSWAPVYLGAARNTRVTRRDAQPQAHVTSLLADHGLLADDQIAAGVELEEPIRARIPQQPLDDEPGDRRAPSMPDRDAVGVDAPAE